MIWFSVEEAARLEAELARLGSMDPELRGLVADLDNRDVYSDFLEDWK